MIYRGFSYQERDLNPHGLNGHKILSLACLPVPPSRQLEFNWYFFLPMQKKERKTGLEPATPTLARSCSTNWATFAFVLKWDCKFKEANLIYKNLPKKIFTQPILTDNRISFILDCLIFWNQFHLNKKFFIFINYKFHIK